MKRDAASTIFRTVVFAGAMLAVPACAKKTPPPASAPANTPPAQTEKSSTDPGAPAPGGASGGEESAPNDETAMPDPCAGGEYDPCSGERPRGIDDDGGGGMGRGFILA